jgi:hypothetical protein
MAVPFAIDRRVEPGSHEATLLVADHQVASTAHTVALGAPGQQTDSGVPSRSALSGLDATVSATIASGVRVASSTTNAPLLFSRPADAPVALWVPPGVGMVPDSYWTPRDPAWRGSWLPGMSGAMAAPPQVNLMWWSMTTPRVDQPPPQASQALSIYSQT